MVGGGQIGAESGRSSRCKQQGGGCVVLCRSVSVQLYGRILLLYKVQQFRCYRSGPRRLLGEYGGIEADRQTTSSRQLAADS